jgi:hypothetical protein
MELQQKFTIIEDLNKYNEDMADQIQSLKHQLQASNNEQISKDSLVRYSSQVHLLNP